jgi:hypothetical protein
MTRFYFFLTFAGKLLCLGCPLRREDTSVICSAICEWSESPLTTRRDYGEVFLPASTRGDPRYITTDGQPAVCLVSGTPARPVVACLWPAQTPLPCCLATTTSTSLTTTVHALPSNFVVVVVVDIQIYFAICSDTFSKIVC